jgi:hypothetical protein
MLRRQAQAVEHLADVSPVENTFYQKRNKHKSKRGHSSAVSRVKSIIERIIQVHYPKTKPARSNCVKKNSLLSQISYVQGCTKSIFHTLTMNYLSPIEFESLGSDKSRFVLKTSTP